VAADGVVRMKVVKDNQRIGSLQRMINYCRKRSPWVLPFNSGGCNGCSIELISAASPRNDVERMGILLKGSPRHADVLVVDGPVATKMRDRLKEVYAQMPEPKAVVAIGSCTLSKGIFYNCYNVAGPVDNVIPVDVWVQGCPPRPEAIIYGIARALEKFGHLRR
jgi:membrane-bound hydrogenase subunit mbhJ